MSKLFQSSCDFITSSKVYAYFKKEQRQSNKSEDILNSEEVSKQEIIKSFDEDSNQLNLSTQESPQKSLHNFDNHQYQDLILLLKENSSDVSELTKIYQQLLNYLDNLKESLSIDIISDEIQQEEDTKQQKLEENIKELLKKIDIDIDITFLVNQLNFLNEDSNSYLISFHRFIQKIEQSQQIFSLNNINTDYERFHEKSSIQQFIDKISLLQLNTNLNQEDFQIQILDLFIESFLSIFIDLIYRRIPLNTFIKSIINFKKPQSLNILSKINNNDVKTIIFQKLNEFEKINFGNVLSSQYQSIPIFYPCCKNNGIYKQNLISAFTQLNESSNKHIILNINTKNIDQKNREPFFTYLFDCKDAISDFNDGINKQGTINLYSNFPNKTLDNIILIDIANLDMKNQEFREILIKIVEYSSVIFLHANSKKDFCINKKQKSVIPSIEMNKIVEIFQQKCKDIMIQILIHNNKSDNQSQILNNYIYQKLENINSQQLKIINVKKNDEEYEYKEIFNSLKKEQISQENKMKKIEEFLYHFLDSENGLQQQQFQLQKFKEEIESQIEQELSQINKKSEKQIDLIQKMFPISNLYSKIYYKEKMFQKLSRYNLNSKEGVEKRQQKEKKIDQLNKDLKKTNSIPNITNFFFKQITSNIYIKQIICSHIFSLWKLPLVIENNKKVIQIQEEIKMIEKQIIEQKLKKDDPEKQKLNQLIKQKNKYLILHDNYDISSQSFVREFCLLSENINPFFNKSQIAQNNYQSIKYYQQSFNQGFPIQFIDKTRIFGNKILKQFIESIDKQQQQDNQNYKIVSVVGPQSTAKSTLLNYLFRCKFETSSARCTKGMYFTKVNFEGMNLLVIDTEGLLSSVFRETSFDNSVMALLFLISHVIIFNIKDESNQNMREMMNITSEVMKLFTSETVKNYTKPDLFIVLRDFCDQKQAEDKKKIVATEISEMSGIFDRTSIKNSKKVQINIKQENIFIFESAFSNSNKFEESYQQINSGFGIEILNLRKAIKKNISSLNGYYTLQEFYEKGQRIWNRLMTHGHELLKCVSVEEYKAKKDIELKGTQLLSEQLINWEQRNIQKQEEIKYIILTKFQNKREEIKQSYDLFCQGMIHDINEKVDNDLLTFYQSDQNCISQISTKEFDLIIEKLQHRNFTLIQNIKYEFHNRIDQYFYNASIEQILIDFNKSIQKMICGEKNLNENEGSFKDLLKEVQQIYKQKIKEAQRQFDIQELLRTQLEQIKSDIKNIDYKDQKCFIQEIQIPYLKDKNQNQLILENLIIQSNNVMISNQEITSQVLKLKNKIDNNGYLQIPKENNNLMRFILNQTYIIFSEFLQEIGQKSKSLNLFQIQKIFFNNIYIKTQNSKQQEIYQTLKETNQKFEKEIYEKMIYIQDILKNSNDWLSRGEKAMNRIQNILIDSFVERSINKLDTQINNDVCKLVQNHTEALDKAFSSVYEKDTFKINIDNFLKYTLDINRYVDEMKRDQIEETIKLYMEQKLQEFSLQIQKIFLELNKIILEFNKKEDFTFQSLTDKLNLLSYEDKSFNIGNEIIFQNKDSAEKYIELIQEDDDIKENEESQLFKDNELSEEANIQENKGSQLLNENEISEIQREKDESLNSEIYNCYETSINILENQQQEFRDNSQDKDISIMNEVKDKAIDLNDNENQIDAHIEQQKNNSFNLIQQQAEDSNIGKINKLKKKVHISKNFLQGMKKQTYQNQEGINFIISEMEKKFNEKLKQQFNQARSKYYEQMIGCQEQCPSCGIKCHLQKDHLDSHDVKDHHFIIGMAGTRKGGVLLCYESCLEVQSSKVQFGPLCFENMQDFCQKLYPEWVSCFDKQSFERDEIFDKVNKIGYSLTAEWFSYYYEQKSLFFQAVVELPEQFLELSKGQEKIDKSYKINWKYNLKENELSNEENKLSENDKTIHQEFVDFMKSIKSLLDIFRNV